MKRNWIVTGALALVLAGSTLSWAHGGHAHKVMGTASAVTPSQIEVKTTDGKTVFVAVNAKTVYKHGKAKADAKMLKVGERVVIEALQEQGAKVATAQTVTMAAASTSAAPAAKSTARP